MIAVQNNFLVDKYEYCKIIIYYFNYLNKCNHSFIQRVYTVLQKYAHTGLNQNLFRSTTLDIITRLLDNAAFVCVHVVGRFSKDLWKEV